MYKFIAIPIKIPTSFFMEINKLIPKLTWKKKRPKPAKPILERKKKKKSKGRWCLPNVLSRLSIPYN